jgi:hypothetical protein
MKKLKFKLDALREEMEILNMGDLISTKGGGAAGYYGYSTWEDFVYAVDHGDVPDGSYFPDGVSGGYGVHGDYGNLSYLHLDAGYGTWNGGGYGSSGGYGGYGGGYYSVTDSHGSYLMDPNYYTSTSGNLYYRVSFDGGTTWQNTQSAFQGNMFSSTYVGPDNPEGYIMNPTNVADFFALVHDMEYDSLGAVGVHGVLFNMDTLKADLLLIANEINVAGGNYGADAQSRFSGVCVAAGISVGVVVKLFLNAANAGRPISY